MSEVVTDFVKKYVAEYGTLPYSVDRPSDQQPATDPPPTQAKPATAAKPKGSKASKGTS